MSKTKTQPNFTKAGVVLNFIYFLYNFEPSMNEIIAQALGHKGENFVEHVQNKLSGYIGDDSVCRPEHILKLMVNLNTSYQKDIIDWVNENYSAGFTGEGLVEE